ncbi:MAG: type II secretion system F family protein [Leptospiraceae bacterium]|nr:type II secretion system F family protein [Leptospiraceae bacterium]MCP5511757.1 type II secretion system F family protein [Leptospiraceae bacterium]
MALYQYTAFNKKGKEEKGIIDANSLLAARNKLKAKGLYVRTMVEDHEKKEREMFPALSRILYRIPRKTVALFVRQLGTLIGAGIPLDRSINNIIDQTENQNFKKVAIEMKTAITEGSSLSQAMEKHPTVFPRQYPSLISVGERTGEYEKTLMRLADLEEASLELKNKVQVAMIYPFIMGLLSMSVAIFLLTVVIPQIQELFSQFDAELPLITRVVIGLSYVLTHYSLLILAVIFGVIFGIYKFKNSKSGRPKWDSFVLSIPIFGSLTRKVLVSNFARNLSVLLGNRVNLIVSLEIVGIAVSNSIFESEIKSAVMKIKEGGKFSDAFAGSQILTPMVLGMIAAGELSDTVPKMMDKLADIYDSEVNNAIKSMTQSLEPIMIVVMGGLIFTIMAAIMTPMYKLTQEIQNL